MTDVKMIVETVCMVGFDELSYKDRDNDGNCAVDGAYRMTLDDTNKNSADLEKEALDRFHATVPVAVLEDFMITARPERSSDRIAGDAWLRLDMDKN